LIEKQRKNIIFKNIFFIKNIFRGSLVTKDLSDIVKADNFVLGSEYLQTVCVAVPKFDFKRFFNF